MIISKFLLNTIANHLIKHFKLNKVMSYVFEDNELDDKTKELENRIKILESMAHPKRDFVTCNKCNKKIKEK